MADCCPFLVAGATAALVGPGEVLAKYNSSELQKIGLRELCGAASATGASQGMRKCNCKKECNDGKCSCNKAGHKCNSRCHKANTNCRNHDELN